MRRWLPKVSQGYPFMKSEDAVWKDWKDTPNGLTFCVKVIPKASRNEIVGWENGTLKVRIQAPPEKGKANAALIAFLSDALHLPQNRIQVLHGATSRVKRLCLLGVHEMPF